MHLAIMTAARAANARMCLVGALPDRYASESRSGPSYGPVRRSYNALPAPRNWGTLKSELFAGIIDIWYKIVAKNATQNGKFWKMPMSAFSF